MSNDDPSERLPEWLKCALAIAVGALIVGSILLFYANIGSMVFGQ